MRRNIPTRLHILTECPLYEEHRHLLRDDKLDIILTDLFSTKKGIARYTEFLTKNECSRTQRTRLAHPRTLHVMSKYIILPPTRPASTTYMPHHSASPLTSTKP
jgi:hypothetical protein